jgi:large subunit ribosomal protein L9
MEIILLTDVEKVGLRGEVVTVTPGYARNFLLPRRLAERATPAKVAELRRRDERRARSEARTLEQGEQIADLLSRTVLRFEVKSGPTGALFGSVTPTDLADEIWRTRKVRVDRRKIDLPDPIKRIGRYSIPIEVFADVKAEVKTLVVPEGSELPPEEELAELEAAEARAAAEAAGESGAEAADVAADHVDDLDAAAEDALEPPSAATDLQVPDDAFDRASDDALAAEPERE